MPAIPQEDVKAEDYHLEHAHKAYDETVLNQDDLAKEQDDAANALAGQEVEGTPAEIRALVRKQDFILVPLMAVGVGLLLVDKSGMGSAATLTLQKDLGLVGSQYSWAVSIYFFGLLLGTYPSNLLLQRYHTGRVLGIAYLCWGTVMLCTTAVKDYRGLFACRFLLGVFESTNNPAFVMTTGRFWMPKEQPVRYSLWAVGNTVLPIPFLVIFYAIGRAPAHPLQQWRWIFVLLGSLTIVMGILILILMPDSPATCWWLTPRQRALAVARIARAQTGIKSHVIKRYQVVEALLDIKVWILAICLVCQQPAPGILSNFSGIIIKGYGYTGLQSLLLQIPGWAVPCVGTPLTGYLATYVPFFQKRKSLIIAVLSTFSLLCEIMLFKFPPIAGQNKAIPLAFLSLANIDQSIYPIINTLVGQNFGGATKRQTAVTIVWMMYCVSNIAVPQSFKAAQSPRYTSGIITTMSMQGLLTVLAIAFYFICRIENRQRDKADEASGKVETDREIILAGLDDETDKRNSRFRYWG